MAAPIDINATQLRVSSVLNRDVKQFGKKYLVDGNEDTCWNSDQGSPQWITIDFEESIVPVELCIQFQGGFAGADCWVEGKMDASSSWEKIDYFYPEDKNSLQTFMINNADKPIVSMKIVFSKSTDFFGRITIYQLKVNGVQR
ncbi:nuclear receptor 2C2-associated protein-like [Ruditapes philippinarum]|uniref:nuclear receptor 2C2-associated protein-like n=1 Tax=Ruditapes philippinarum TaxID=129788 RepID=UPI00295C09D3|nr:nuclear receptor 2C2-associated protein-like [Ruditapes philippinarum]